MSERGGRENALEGRRWGLGIMRFGGERRRRRRRRSIIHKNNSNRRCKVSAFPYQSPLTMRMTRTSQTTLRHPKNHRPPDKCSTLHVNPRLNNTPQYNPHHNLHDSQTHLRTNFMSQRKISEVSCHYVLYHPAPFPPPSHFINSRPISLL